jgi:hypothetical protein
MLGLLELSLPLPLYTQTVTLMPKSLHLPLQLAEVRPQAQVLPQAETVDRVVRVPLLLLDVAVVLVLQLMEEVTTIGLK